MAGKDDPDAPRERAPIGVFFALSVVAHGLLFVLLAVSLAPASGLETLNVPDLIELGVADGAPGEAGEPPPPAAAKAPDPEHVHKPLVPRDKPRDKPRPEPAASGVAVDASVPDEADEVALDSSDELEVAPSETEQAGALASEQTGVGLAPLGRGGGMGFGAGGFGDGTGGPPGAIIGLHVDLDRVRASSLILETSALLELIPEWLALLEGSGLDVLDDLSRVFVASPSLARSALVVSARVRGAQPAIEAAIQRLAKERGRPARLAPSGAMRVAPWHNRGPTERVLGLIGRDQIVIARPPDVARATAVSAALAVRHGKDPRMERLPGSLALLAMYEGEAAALSIEGTAQYVRGDKTHVPPGLRISLRPLDEHYAELRGYAYYRSAAEAQAALPVFDALRVAWIDHPQAQYLGLQAALEEAVFAHEGRTATVQARITLHQVRYLLGYVSRALKPRAR